MAQADYVNNAIRALITAAGTKPSTTPARAAYAEFVAALAGHPPRPIQIEANAVGRLELRQVDALLCDLASDVCGTLRHIVEGMAWRLA
jgi:hypothetical protein